MTNAIDAIEKIRNNGYSVLIALAAAVLVAGVAAPALAASGGSLEISDTRPGEEATYTISLDGLSSTPVEAVELELDEGTAGSFDNGASTATSGTWDDDSSGSTLAATTTSAEALSDGTLEWTGVTNASAGNYTATFTSYENDDYTSEVDTLSVNFAIVEGQDVSLTVDPTFSFAVAGVADSETVNSATTTAESTSSTIPFGQVTETNNGVVAQDLTINTNAQDGYTIHARYTGQLESGSNTFDDLPHAYASPDTFTATGTEAFGFTTEGVAAFDDGNWAAMETSNLEVANSSEALSEPETTRVGYQAGVSTSTPAGTYNTTVIYTATPLY